MTTETTATTGRQGLAERFSLIDGDVHPLFAQDWTDELAPYVSSEWRMRFRGSTPSYGKVGADLPAVRYSLPGNPFYPKNGGNLRLDLIEDDGTLPCTVPATAARDLLDAHGIDRALLLPQSVLGIGAFPTPDIAAVIASAVNSWTADVWLSADPRWRTAICVAHQDDDAAVAEIEKWGDDPRFVGVFISLGRPMLGERHFHRIYAAAQHYGLPIVLHPTGTEGIYTSSAQTAGGPAQYYMDQRVSFVHPYPASVASLVSNGTFERFPDLMFLFSECGFAWLPDLMWRMDSYWKGGRTEVPWVKKPPSEYIRERVRFTSQPMIEPPKREHIAAVLDMIDAERTLIFSTDFPHWDADTPADLAADLPDSIRRRVLVENAVELFGERLA